jgi:hypothetical protein
MSTPNPASLQSIVVSLKEISGTLPADDASNATRAKLTALSDALTSNRAALTEVAETANAVTKAARAACDTEARHQAKIRSDEKWWGQCWRIVTVALIFIPTAVLYRHVWIELKSQNLRPHEWLHFALMLTGCWTVTALASLVFLSRRRGA